METPDIYKKAFRSLPGRIVGREAIGCLPDIVHLRVEDARVDDDYLSINCLAISTPGLKFPSPPRFTLSSSVVFLSARWAWLGASHVGWELFFDQAVITNVKSIASQLPEGRTCVHDYTSRPITGASRSSKFKFIAHNTAGPVSSKLFSYINEQRLQCGQSILRRQR